MLKQILKKDYPTFVKLLGQNIRDPKFIAAIATLRDKDKVDMVSMTPTVGNLIPTQNEIDITKSLNFPLTQAASMLAYLKGGPVAPNGSIVTSGGGRYIIDGHHRWSQVCVCNPNCKISANDMSDIKGPVAALKSAQLGIVSAIGQLPAESVKGSNLLTIDERSLKDYVIKTITPEVIDVMRQFKLVSSTDDQQARNEAANYLWQNTTTMQKNNQPITSAPERGIMPQTDKADKDPKWYDHAPNPETVAEELARLRNLLKNI